MRHLFASLLITCSSLAGAQYNDACSWTSAAVNADLTDDFSVGYATEVRLFKNATSLDSYINEISLNYKPLKGMSLGLDYRYSRKNQEGYYEGVHRFGADVSYEQKFDDLGLRLKVR